MAMQMTSWKPARWAPGLGSAELTADYVRIPTLSLMTAGAGLVGGFALRGVIANTFHIDPPILLGILGGSAIAIPSIFKTSPKTTQALYGAGAGLAMASLLQFMWPEIVKIVA
jgi:hypothetical protein